MIQTRGFDVNVLPQLPAVDPSLFAVDPTKLTSGALSAFQTIQAENQMKAFQDQQAELANTRQARIDQAKALSQIQVLAAQKQQELQDQDIQAAQAKNALGIATDTGALANLPGKIGLDQLTTTLGAKKATDEITNFEKDKALADRLKAGEASYYEAHSRYFDAEAEKNRAMAKAAGLAPDVSEKAWQTQIGDISAHTGKTPDQLKALYASGAVNEKGIPLASELAALEQRLKTQTLGVDVFDDSKGQISQGLKHWLGGNGLVTLAKAGAQPDNTVAPVPAAGAASNAAPIVRIDAKGNIQRGPATATPAAPILRPVPGQAAPSNVPVTDQGQEATGGLAKIASDYGPAALLLANGAKGGVQLGRAGQLAKIALARAGSALPSAAGIGGRLAALGSAAATPVAALDLGNKAIGSALSDKATGNMTALEGIAQGLISPSFNQMATDAKYDEVSQRIRMVMTSPTLTPIQKETQLAMLLSIREDLANQTSR